MLPRSFYIAAIVLLFCALVLSLLSSISLPTFPVIDFVRISYANTPKSTSFFSQLRFGIWGLCSYDGNGKRSCSFTGHGYGLLIKDFDQKTTVFIGSSWTRGLAIHPVATGVTAIAFGFACSKYEQGPFITALSSAVAAFLMTLAFIVDIALYAFVKQQVNKLPHPGTTTTSSAFWMTFVSLILVITAGGSVFYGRRKDVGSEYPTFSSGKGGFLSRFRKS
ncbi:pali-domain-containing protein [Mycena alexandri]|uniref:Pali-domain-containing protein n=1 Tax=Mycena alexandri TaxID=1745969 RepID=A0AAD6X6T6_9AGAR|nr:pali-domain-containing protein [Mycena alexandri]